MTKVTSGPFQGGLSVADYYPTEVDGVTYSSGATAGTFDTGKSVGAKVQLFGTIPSPCEPSSFSLDQQVTLTRNRLNGITSKDEGKTFDDLAGSAKNFFKPPYRQEWLGGGGYNISMADIPGLAYYTATTDLESDRDFVTSLKGSRGQKSVSWSTSIRMTKGVVTRNTVS